MTTGSLPMPVLQFLRRLPGRACSLRCASAALLLITVTLVTADPMEMPCGKKIRVATHNFPPFTRIDTNKCVNQVCPPKAFGCNLEGAGCNDGGITYRLVEKEIKKGLQAECKKLGKSETIVFEWYVPTSDTTSASSPISMLCNSAFDNGATQPGSNSSSTLCPSAIEGGPLEYKGPANATGVCSGPKAEVAPGKCVSPGPDMAAGSIQIRIDRLSRVQFSSSFLTVSQQVAIRRPSADNFFKDLPVNLGLIFGPFEPMLWVYIMVEILVITVVLLFTEGAVNDSIAEGWTSLIDAFYWSFTTVLGGADKAPVSVGGKIVFVAHAIFALIIGATYTGAVAAFLISSAGLESIEGFESLQGGSFSVAIRGPTWDSTAATPAFAGSHSGGNSLNTTVESTQFMNMQALMKADSQITFNMFTYKRMETRLKNGNPWTYEAGKSPCDDPTNELGVFDAVMCGSDSNSKTPMALIHDDYSLIHELNMRKQKDGHCKLITMGTSVMPAGLGFAFPLNSEMHVPFSKVILNLKKTDKINDIVRNFSLHKDNCAFVPVNELELNLFEMGGLYIIVLVGLFVSCLIGALERYSYFKAQAEEEAEEDGDEAKSGGADDNDEGAEGAIAAQEEDTTAEYNCIIGLLDELGEQMDRIEGLSGKLAELREKAQEVQEDKHSVADDD